MLCASRHLRLVLIINFFSWIILNLSLNYNKTVWHVFVNKTIVSLIISDITVCASLYFWLHYKPDMIFPFFSIISITFFSVSWKIVLKHFKDIKWRQKICCVITNCRKMFIMEFHYWFNIFQLDGIHLSLFVWKYIFSILFVLESHLDLVVHLEFP